MHALWKGAISFGMVHIPVKMFAATEDKDIAMKHIHKDCGGSISHVKTCRTCEREVESENIVKGYEYEAGKYVIFEKEELERILPDSSKEIKIVDFVQLTEIDPIYFQKTYYLAPGDTGATAYHLLYEALRSTGRIGICKVSIRSKSSLAAIRIIDKCLALETIYYPDEIRSVEQVPNINPVQVNEKELHMARLLIEHLTCSFDPGKYTDDYRHQLIGLIEKKVAGEEVHAAPSGPTSSVLDLMAALQASLEAYQPSEEGTAKPKKTKSKSKKAKIDAEIDEPA